MTPQQLASFTLAVQQAASHQSSPTAVPSTVMVPYTSTSSISPITMVPAPMMMQPPQPPIFMQQPSYAASAAPMQLQSFYPQYR